MRSSSSAVIGRSPAPPNVANVCARRMRSDGEYDRVQPDCHAS
jgi:hypothetical protein